MVTQEYKMKDYGFVIEIDGVAYYRHNDDPTKEIAVKDGKITKLKTKIKKKVNNGNNI